MWIKDVVGGLMLLRECTTCPVFMLILLSYHKFVLLVPPFCNINVTPCYSLLFHCHALEAQDKRGCRPGNGTEAVSYAIFIFLLLFNRTRIQQLSDSSCLPINNNTFCTVFVFCTCGIENCLCCILIG